MSGSIRSYLIDEYISFINDVERCIKHSINQYNLTKQQTVDALFTILHVPPSFTQLVWEMLEEENPQLFQDYYARLESMNQHQNGNSNSNGHNSNGSRLSTEDMLAHLQDGLENMTLNGARNGRISGNGGASSRPSSTSNSVGSNANGSLSD